MQYAPRYRVTKKQKQMLIEGKSLKGPDGKAIVIHDTLRKQLKDYMDRDWFLNFTTGVIDIE